MILSAALDNGSHNYVISRYITSVISAVIPIVIKQIFFENFTN